MSTIINPSDNNPVVWGQVDTDGTLAADLDTLVASQKAVKTYVDAAIAGVSGGGGGGSSPPFTFSALDVLVYGDDGTNRRIYLDSSENPVIQAGGSESGGSFGFDSTNNNTPIIKASASTAASIGFDTTSFNNPFLYAIGEPGAAGFIGFDDVNSYPFIYANVGASAYSYIGFDSNSNPIISGSSNSGSYFGFDAFQQTPVISYNGFQSFALVGSNSYNPSLFNVEGFASVGIDNSGSGFLQSASESGGFIGFTDGQPIISPGPDAPNPTLSFVGFDNNGNPKMSGSSSSGTYLGFDTDQYPAIYYGGNPIFSFVPSNGYNPSIYNVSNASPILGGDGSGHGYIQDASESGGFIGFLSGGSPVIQCSESSSVTIWSNGGESSLSLYLAALDTAPVESPGHVWEFSGSSTDFLAAIDAGAKVLMIE